MLLDKQIKFFFKRFMSPITSGRSGVSWIAKKPKRYSKFFGEKSEINFAIDSSSEIEGANSKELYSQ